MTSDLDETCQLYHVAFLVADLSEAITAFQSTAGHTFNAPTSATMRVAAGFGGDGDANDDAVESFAVAYSTRGPLHIELIEQGNTGLFGSQHPLGFHHAGYWVDDVAAQVDALTANGHTVETTVRTVSGGLLAVFVTPKNQAGVRLELVSTRYRERLEAWFKAE